MSIEIQVKSKRWGWSNPIDPSGAVQTFTAEWSEQEFKDLRQMMIDYVERHGGAGVMLIKGGVATSQVKHALIESGMAPEKAADFVSNSVSQLSTGLKMHAFCGYVLVGTVRVLKSRPTLEEKMAGKKIRWGRPMKGIYHDVLRK